MSKLVAPHGGKGLVYCKLEGAELAAELRMLQKSMLATKSPWKETVRSLPP
jgi:hypothetical protein